MTPSALLWNNSSYEVGSLRRGVQRLDPLAADAAPPRRRTARSVAPPQPSPDEVAEAYAQFLLGHRLEENDDEAGAIAAYKRAMELDPTAADIPAELAGLYLQQNKVQEAMTAAEAGAEDRADQSRSATACSASSTRRCRRAADPAARGRGADAADGNLGEGDRPFRARDRGRRRPNRSERSRDAGAALRPHRRVRQGDSAADRSGQPGARLAGRSAAARRGVRRRRPQPPTRSRGSRSGRASDPRLLPALADFYERERRWQDAAGAYAAALQRAPRNARSQTRYASGAAQRRRPRQLDKARDALTEVVAARPTDARALYLLSQAQRRLGDSPGGRSVGAPRRSRRTREPARLLRARRGARRAASVPGDHRRARAGRRRQPRQDRRQRVRRQHAAAAPRVSRTRSSGSTTRRSRPSTKRAGWRRRIRRSPAT